MAMSHSQHRHHMLTVIDGVQRAIFAAPGCPHLAERLI
jgi:hypothetical protein